MKRGKRRSRYDQGSPLRSLRGKSPVAPLRSGSERETKHSPPRWDCCLRPTSDKKKKEPPPARPARPGKGKKKKTKRKDLDPGSIVCLSSQARESRKGRGRDPEPLATPKKKVKEGSRAFPRSPARRRPARTRGKGIPRERCACRPEEKGGLSRLGGRRPLPAASHLKDAEIRPDDPKRSKEKGGRSCQGKSSNEKGSTRAPSQRGGRKRKTDPTSPALREDPGGGGKRGGEKAVTARSNWSSAFYESGPARRQRKGKAPSWATRERSRKGLSTRFVRAGRQGGINLSKAGARERVRPTRRFASPRGGGKGKDPAGHE